MSFKFSAQSFQLQPSIIVEIKVGGKTRFENIYIRENVSTPFALREGFHVSLNPQSLWNLLLVKLSSLIKNFGYYDYHPMEFKWGIRNVASVFEGRESSNDRRVCGPKAHSSVPLARYT